MGASDRWPIHVRRTEAFIRSPFAFLSYSSSNSFGSTACGIDSLARNIIAITGNCESPFEEEVAAAVVRRGLTPVPQVGCGGFRIDLALTHPNRPGEFCLGIECDGATSIPRKQHETATAFVNLFSKTSAGESFASGRRIGSEHQSASWNASLPPTNLPCRVQTARLRVPMMKPTKPKRMRTIFNQGMSNTLRLPAWRLATLKMFQTARFGRQPSLLSFVVALPTGMILSNSWRANSALRELGGRSVNGLKRSFTTKFAPAHFAASEIGLPLNWPSRHEPRRRSVVACQKLIRRQDVNASHGMTRLRWRRVFKRRRSFPGLPCGGRGPGEECRVAWPPASCFVWPSTAHDE